MLSRIPKRLVATSLCLCCYGAVAAADVALPPVNDGGAATAADPKVTAQRLVREGMELVKRFNLDKAHNATAIVDAAICFSKARALVEKSGDEDMIGEIQANLFWCKKQMDMDALKDYVAKKGSDGSHAVEQMAAVAAAKPAESEASAYFKRAEKYASAHPDDLLQIAIRFLEVAERFPGATEGTEANKRALAAQQDLMKKVSEAAAAARETRFTKRTTVEPGSTAVPALQAQKDAQAQLRKTYVKPYAKKDLPGKKRLARRLLSEASANKTDAAIYYTMITESIRLAAESEDYESLLDGIDLLASSFTGVDVATEKRNALKKMSGKPTAAAILKLLDTPDDPAANLTAGRWFCFVSHRWEDGFRMLALSTDEGAKKAAQMELDKPSTAEEQLSVADTWYDFGKKSSIKEEKNGACGRAMMWYQQIVTNLQGVTKDKVTKRIEEIDKMLPLDPDSIDWDALTPNQWSKLKATKVIEVTARVDRTDSGVSLAAGQSMRAVANPADTWSMRLWGDAKATMDWHGNTDGDTIYWTDGSTTHQPLVYKGLRVGALVVWVGTGERQACGVVTGPGQVYLAPHIGFSSGGDRAGSIKVKLIPVNDDE
jgi:hypothetical protein